MRKVELKFEYQKPKLVWRIVWAILAFFLLLSIIFTVLAYRKTKKFLTAFSRGAEISESAILTTTNEALEQWRTLLLNNGEKISSKNFLILGTDELSGREGAPILTDSILLLNLNLKTAQIKTLALPRDLYNEAYQTRINALYHYGLERHPDNPEQFPSEVISEMSGVDIDHTLVLGIEELEALINILDEIEINVPTAFTDSQFPRTNVDVSVETDPAILYEEISFSSGLQKMDAQTALKYMRSRYSHDDEGTDLARSQRQQLVIQSLFKQLSNFQYLIQNPDKMGQLYRFYLDHFAQNLPLTEIVKIAYSAFYQLDDLNSFKFQQKSLPVYPADPEGVIYNPPLWETKQQWIYQIKDQERFKSEIENFLK